MTKTIYNYLIAGFLILLQFHVSPIFGQQIEGNIKTIGKQYQRITIPQEYRTLIGNDLGKLRIKDKNGSEVQYILDIPIQNQKNFTAIPFDKYQTDSSETIIIKNPTKKRINSFLLKIANTNAEKKYSIEGSYDQNQWFALVNSATLNDLQSVEETAVITAINFPLNDYAFIRIRVNNKNSNPINILDIGQLEIKNINQQYEKLKQISFSINENKKEKKSIVTIHKIGKSPFDIIKFHINNPAFYTRSAFLYGKEDATRKKKVATIRTGEQFFDLSNTNAQHVEVSDLEYPDTFYIDIQNDNNPPLQIDSITLYQNPIHIIAFLDENNTYSLQTDTTWTTPIYDINKLNIDFSKIAENVIVKDIKIAQSQAKSDKENKSGKIILIISSIIGTLIVFYFGLSLIKDMKKG